MKAWLAYATAAAGLLALVVIAVHLLFAGAGAAIAAAAVVAYAVQVIAFAILVWTRRRGSGFAAGWGAGTLLRFAAVIGFALWVTRRSELPAEPALLGLVGFVFVLVLLEPIFLRNEG